MADILDTVVIGFGEDVSADDAESFYSKIEYDDYLNGNKPGSDPPTPKRTFHPGEICNILVHLQPGWAISHLTYTSGEARSSGVVVRSYEMDRVFFPHEDGAPAADHYPLAVPNIDFSYGNTANLFIEDREMQLSQYPAILDLTYSFQAYSIQIIPPGGLTLSDDQSWPLGVVVWVQK